LKWDENFYSAQVGGKEFLAEIQERGKLNNGKTITYAKGLMVTEYRGLQAVRHGGSWGGYRAELLRFPEQHFSVACLCNVGNANPSRRANLVADVYLASLMKPKTEKKDEDEEQKKPVGNAAQPGAEQLKAYLGEYWSEELGVAYRVGVNDGRLKVTGIVDRAGLPRANNFSDAEIRAVGADKFSVGNEGVTMAFQRDAQAKAGSFSVDAGRTTGMKFVRQEQ